MRSNSVEQKTNQNGSTTSILPHHLPAFVSDEFYDFFIDSAPPITESHEVMLSNRTTFSRHLLFLPAVSMLPSHHFGPHYLSHQLGLLKSLKCSICSVAWCEFPRKKLTWETQKSWDPKEKSWDPKTSLGLFGGGWWFQQHLFSLRFLGR